MAKKASKKIEEATVVEATVANSNPFLSVVAKILQQNGEFKVLDTPQKKEGAGEVGEVGITYMKMVYEIVEINGTKIMKPFEGQGELFVDQERMYIGERVGQ